MNRKPDGLTPIPPPSIYMQLIEEPKIRGNTNAHLLEWAIEMRQALRQANSDKAAMRRRLMDNDPALQ